MNEKQIKALLKAGKIRGYTVVTGGRGVGKQEASRGLQRTYESDAKKGLKMALMQFCQDRKLPLLAEQRFHVERKWRFDWLIPGSRPIAIEYEGLGFKKTGHTSSDGYSDNTTKYREAAKVGIAVLRYTYQNWQQAVIDLDIFFVK